MNEKLGKELNCIGTITASNSNTFEIVRETIREADNYHYEISEDWTIKVYVEMLEKVEEKK